MESENQGWVRVLKACQVSQETISYYRQFEITQKLFDQSTR